MSDTKDLAERFRERRYGHPEIWECTLDEFVEKVTPVLQEHRDRNKVDLKELKLAAGFLRLKFESKELKGTIEYEVSNAIQESMIYHTNVLGE